MNNNNNVTIINMYCVVGTYYVLRVCAKNVKYRGIYICIEVVDYCVKTLYSQIYISKININNAVLAGIVFGTRKKNTLELTY